MGGNVGTGTRLGALTVTTTQSTAGNGFKIGGNITANSLTASGVTRATITASSTINTSTFGGAINFGGLIEGTSPGAPSLTLNAGSGSITLGSTVGAGVPLGAVALTSSTLISLGGNITSDGGAMTLTGPVTLTASGTTVLDPTNAGGTAAGAAINFSSTIDGTVAGSQALTLTGGSGGIITLGGNVGTGTRLGALTVTTTQSTAGNGFKIGGNITANSLTASGVTRTTLTASSTINTSTFGGAINFGGIIEGASASSQTLTLAAGAGSITFSSTLGATTQLNVFTVTNGSGVSFAGDVKCVSGTIGAPITIVGDRTITTAP